MIIGIAAEGPTDQIVLDAIIQAFFAADDEEPLIRFVQPERDPQDHADFGGWELVFEWLRSGGYRKALQTNDIIVIHVDTDVCDRPGFDVARHNDGKVRDDRELVACVIKRLSQMIDADVLAEHLGRIVFAIAVNEIECWLLPLIFDNDRAEKTQGCCDAASHQLRKKKRPGLAAGGKKLRTAYIDLVREARKRKDVDSARKRSPSLDAFVADLEARCRPTPPAAPAAG